MAGWVSIHRVSTHEHLRTKEQMVAATVRAVEEAGLDGPSHRVLEAAVAAEDAPH
ncbi:hypothetical protein [Modestobacter sp. Leaf380]|uniref:hypothetical protein n=1 Tax=Modestobacter sp. Leaf380 TaxID=1736356 RepID=UPI0012F78238|nr:hypothetical protein [Modestobacter sp. Leaf380]